MQCIGDLLKVVSKIVHLNTRVHYRSFNTNQLPVIGAVNLFVFCFYCVNREFCFLLAFPGWLTVDGGFLQPSFLLHHDELSQYHIYNTSFPLLFPRVLFCPPLSPSPQSQEGHEGTSYCNHYAIRSSCKTAFGVSLTSYVWSVFDKAYTSHIMVFSVLYCGSTSDLCSWIYIIIKGIFGQIQADRIPNINANS